MLNYTRLASGLILFFFVVCHLINVCLGLISVAWMEAAKPYFMGPWRSLPGTVLLASSGLIHLGLGLLSFYQRRGFDLRERSVQQLILGLLTVPLLAGHVVGARALFDAFDLNSNFTIEFYSMFVAVPWLAAVQSALIIVVWIHAWWGLTGWLRLKPWYPRWQGLFDSVGLLVPALTLASFLSVGLRLKRQWSDPIVRSAYETASGFREEYVDWVFHWTDRVLLVFLFFLLLTFGLRWLRSRRADGGNRSKQKLIYLGTHQMEMDVLSEATILDTLRLAGIQHASVCGGRGRCSTCRVRIVAGEEHQPPPDADEARVLARIAAPANVRLACQLRPTASLTVAPLIEAKAAPDNILAPSPDLQGREAEVAILFADIRDFTSLSQDRLPYDTVFLLNRYFAAMGAAITEAGGRIDKFIGDGIMAVFDTADAAGNAAAAVKAAANMAIALERFNQSLGRELEQPIRIGIGVHFGTVIVGQMGYGSAVQLTAIGDAVNVASRLEQATKDQGVQLVISDDLLEAAGLTLDKAPPHQLTVRGISKPVSVRIIDDAAQLL